MSKKDPFVNWLYKSITDKNDKTEPSWYIGISSILLYLGIIGFSLYNDTSSIGYGIVTMCGILILQAVIVHIVPLTHRWYLNWKSAKFENIGGDFLMQHNHKISVEDKTISFSISPKLTCTFIAIDFEYLILGRQDTPCQLGVVVVVDGIIIERWGTLIHVPSNIKGELSPGNGITRDMVVHAPTFEEVIKRIDTLYHGYELVGHNISTEQNVLRKTFKRYGINSWLSNATWHDTCSLMHGKSLSNACAELGIPLSHHHDALADAEACAQIFMKITGCELKESTVRVPIKENRKHKNHTFIAPTYSSFERNEIVLTGKNVVLTGTFNNFPNRNVLKERLQSIGANVQSNIRKNTNILIVGDHGTTGWGKCQKANEQGVLIVSEHNIIPLLQ